MKAPSKEVKEQWLLDIQSTIAKLEEDSKLKRINYFFF